MTDLVTLMIDGESVSVPAGTTILKAAQAVGIRIPTICFHDYCSSNGLCRMCVVEVEGARTLVASCVGQVSAGMKVKTRTPRVERARRTVLELLSASVDLSDAPEILELLAEYSTNQHRFPGAQRRTPPVLDDNPMYIRDYAKCILCWRCVQVCAEDAQYSFAINFSERGYETQIGTFFEKPMPETTCVFCGQCVGVCPSGALKPRRQWLLEQGQEPVEIVASTRTQRRRHRWEEIGKEQES